MSEQNIIAWEQDADGIVVLTIDDPNQGANTMNDRYISSMRETVDRLYAEKDTVTGVVLTSGKKTFFAGGDLKNLLAVQPDQAEQIYNHSLNLKADLRRLETLGKPVVTCINGAALGGGLEIALATHHRIAADVKGVKIGLPEVTLGLLPGGGGIVRTVRKFGIMTALTQHLMQGQQRGPQQALEAGVIDEVVSSVEELVRPRRRGSRPIPSPVSSRGTSRATRSPAAPRPPRRSPRTCPRSPRTCVSRSRAPTCRHRARSSPRPSRAARSTSTTP
ncbi:enoyl-CoA hydratase/isomerase family protein [Prescottella sp. R16]|uniref:enoyl-CoA hydratase/isomerase family protein n=1 Tax=Prescottella sp. R16 TaxID=3064529 RepID=UPI00351D4ABC